MNDLPTSCVLDASVGIKLFLDEDDSKKVETFLRMALSDPSNVVCVPDLFYIECANILWKKVRWDAYPKELALGNLTDLRALRLAVTPTSQLMEHALEIACSSGVTAYDACYVALSEMADVPLLTADRRLRDLLQEEFALTLLE